MPPAGTVVSETLTRTGPCGGRMGWPPWVVSKAARGRDVGEIGGSAQAGAAARPRKRESMGIQVSRRTASKADVQMRAETFASLRRKGQGFHGMGNLFSV